MRMRTSLYGYDRRSVKEALLVTEQSHLRSKHALTEKIEELKAEGKRLEAELAARRAAASGSDDESEGGERDG
ncbi:MAG TPA: hypothetical protein VEZ72_22335 [Paenibacillus sp.]|nr:hypothetical protein [Paenibacillus sp.]